MSKNVPITVLMAVYNGEKYLRQSVESILNQTFKNFEFLIINDGSTDKTSEVLNSFNDKRIRVINNIKNQGLTKCLHDGVTLSKGQYIARLDVDDISISNRLEIQKKYLDENPDVLVVHSMFHHIDQNNKIIKKNIGNKDSINLIKWNLIWKNRLQHPTVMFRKEVLTKYKLNYNLKYKRSQDFEFWAQISRVGDIFLIPIPLILYRIHDESITNKVFGNKHLTAQKEIIKENIFSYGIKVDEGLIKEVAILSWQLSISPFGYKYKYSIGKLHDLLNKIENNFIQKFSIEKKEIKSAQALQIVKWAFFIFNTSKKYSFKLLGESLKRDKKIIVSPFFISTLFAFILGKQLLKILYNYSQKSPRSTTMIMKFFNFFQNFFRFNKVIL
jgi:glycosyltransferase involved in cell wall biosynthesis